MAPGQATAVEPVLRLVACGSVDDGKSTLIGRLLVVTGSVPDDVVEASRRSRRGSSVPAGEIDHSLLTDGLEAERDQGITIDVAHKHLFLPSGRRVLLADAPGHEQYTRNMAVAAATADAALLLVDAVRGLRPQTFRHLTICALMGVDRLIFAVNKIDAVGYERQVFERLAAEALAAATRLGLPAAPVIPVSALRGDNVAERSPRTPWYSGPTVLQAVERAGGRNRDAAPWRLPVQHVILSGVSRHLAGTVLRCPIRVGDRVTVTSTGAEGTVAELIGPRGTAGAVDPGEPAAVRLEPDLDVSRGDLLVLTGQGRQPADRFSVDLLWMSEQPLARGQTYWLVSGPAKVGVTVTAVRHRVDVESAAELATRVLRLNQVGRIELATERPLVLDPYDECRETGGVLLVDRISADTVAAGMVRSALRRSDTITPRAFIVDRTAREALAGHRAVVVWFTGLSGAGKSTIADLVERELHGDGVRTYIIDGDNLRSGLSKDLGFAVSDRAENVRRAAEVARLMLDAGVVVLVCLVSPFRADREGARELIGAEDFVEVYVDTPLAVCADRDVKGLYAKARSGQLPDLTGVGQEYQPPLKPDVAVTGAGDPKRAALEVADAIRAKIIRWGE